MAQVPTNEQIVRLLEEVKAELAEVKRLLRRVDARTSAPGVGRVDGAGSIGGIERRAASSVASSCGRSA